MIHHEKSINYVHKDKFEACKAEIERALASEAGLEIVALSGYDWQNTFCGWIGVRQPTVPACTIAAIRPHEITAENCVAACEAVVRALSRSTAGRQCESCGSVYAGTHVPFKCVACERPTINTCPSCESQHSLAQYREMPGSVFTCPHCQCKLSLGGGTDTQWLLAKKVSASSS